MDTHAQIGPEKGSYDTDVLALAGLLAAGRTVYVRLAARSTQYQLIVARADGIQPIATGETRDLIDGIGEPFAEWLFLAKLGDLNGALFLSGYVHPSYIAGKLDVNRADADTIADFANRLLRAGALLA